MFQTLSFLMSSFWLGAAHAATPGHGKTIAAAYIVGARGKPVDAIILGIFVTLSHTSGIVMFAALAYLGAGWLMPQRVEAWLALVTGAMVVVLALWTLWTQRRLLAALSGNLPLPGALAHGHAHGDGHEHAHDHGPEHAHEDGHGHGSEPHVHREPQAGFHRHGFGIRHTHSLDAFGAERPNLLMLLGLGVAGGLLPDPAALGLLLSALAQGKVILGLWTVLVFSVGFALTLVMVGIAAASVGNRLMDFLSGAWPARIQIATSLLILSMGFYLSFMAWQQLGKLA